MIEPKPEPTIEQIEQEANNISEEFRDNESFSVITCGITASSYHLGLDQYLYNLSLNLIEEGCRRKISDSTLVPRYIDPLDSRLNVKNNSIEEIANLSLDYQQKGLSVGYIHGHFRIFTPNHWLTFAWAQEHCDVLIIGIEDGFRTSMYKDLFTHFTERQRLSWLYSSRFKGNAFIIDKSLPYSNGTYESLIDMIRPNYYFIPQNAILIDRAHMLGVEPVIRPERKGWSSSQFLNTCRNEI